MPFRMPRWLALLSCTLAAAFVLRTVWLGSVPYTNFDEAWYGIRSFELLHGRVPFTLSGQNDYTGSLIEYLRVPFYAMLGVSQATLKLPIVLLNVAMLGYAFLFVRRFYDERTALIATILLTFAPWHVIESRFADSAHTSLPFFGLAFMYHLTREGPKHQVLAGLFAAVGIHVHVLFSLFVGLIALALPIATRTKLFTRAHGVVALIAAAGFVQRVAPIVLGGEGSPQTFHHVGAGARKLIALADLLPFTYGLLDSRLFYLRMTGDVALPVLPIASLLVAAACVAAVRAKLRKDLCLLAGALVYAFVVSLNVDNMSLRYYLFPLILCTLVLASFLARLDGRIGAALAGVLVASDLTYVTANYFVQYARTGGAATTYWQGNFEETSRHFVDLCPLIGFLREHPERAVAIPNKPYELAGNLAFWELAHGARLLQRPNASGIAAIFYTEDLDAIRFRHDGYEVEQRVDLAPLTVLLLARR